MGERFVALNPTLTVVALLVMMVMMMIPENANAERSGGNGCSFENQRVECGKLSCDPILKRCVPCTNSSQCHEAVMVCSSSGECEVGSLSETFSRNAFLALIFTILICAVAVVAGLGGGGILVPMFAALVEMPLIAAVGLSQAAICGQSAFNMIYQVTKTMPTQTPNEVRPLINYQYLAILLPLSLIGTLLGSLGGRVVPDWLRLALLFLLLTSVLQRVIEKAKRQYMQDTSTSSGSRIAEVVKLTSTRVVVHASPDDANPNKDDGEGGDGIRQGVASELANINFVNESASLVLADSFDGPLTIRSSRREMALLAIGFVVLLVCNIVRSSMTVCGSVDHALLFIIPISVLVGLWWLGKEMAAMTLTNVQSGFLSPDHMTFQWNARTMTWFPFAAIIAGAGTALLGNGGGLVLSFVLFEAELTPEEASATSGFANLLIASESALLMLFQGQLVPDYATMYFMCGVVSTVLGQSGFMAYIRWSKKRFLIVTSLACIIGGSLLMLLSYGLFEVIEQVKRHDGSLWAFGHICNARR